ncbi:MAG TPA: hypothetical protein VNF29_11335 [Candidatus Binataceae bacterium]|nr:hypothetical protein [Candidatus Binataceae bacterium]
MIRAALACMAVAALGGCAGTAHYTVQPFYDPAAQRMVCCRAEAFSGKDVSAVTFDLSMQPGGSITVHFTEQGVGATAPLTAQGAVISNVATAAGNTAAAIVKLTP